MGSIVPDGHTCWLAGGRDGEEVENEGTLNLLKLVSADYSSQNSREAVVHRCWDLIPATG